MIRVNLCPLMLLALLLADRAQVRAQGVSGEAAFTVIQKNCLVCHDGKLRSGRLVMESAGGLLRGGSRGPALVPGRSADSLLIKMVTGELAPKMPLEGELTAGEIEVLRRWIDAGAPAWKKPAADSNPLDIPDIRPVHPVRTPVNSLAFSPDGGSLAAAGYREVRLLDPAGLRLVKALSGLTDMVRAVAFSPDGRALAAGGGEPARYGEVLVWDTESWKSLTSLRGHTDYVYDLAFSPDGRILATSSYDRLIKLWDAASGSEIRTLKEHTDAVFPIAFSPDGTRIASGGADRTVKIWDVATGRRLYTLSDSTDVIFTLAFHPSGRRITASGGDKYIRTWTLTDDGGSLAQAIIAHEAEVTKVLYLGDGKRLASAAADRTLKIWNMETGEVERILERQPDWVLDLAQSRDGKFLAAARYDGSIAFYEIREESPDLARREK